ncbi:MAG TPA: DUF814 domain-containing protein [Thermoplasmata archaeon]|nr:DUF814 domain-containing protein [Thermoplasmata archaeon]
MSKIGKIDLDTFEKFVMQRLGRSNKKVIVPPQIGVDASVIDIGNGYLRVIRNPKYGYGKNMNPCIDCRIFMLNQAKKYAKKVGAKFIFTGEVLDERPMSQHYKALKIIEKEADLEGKILRPLSVKLLPKTEAEKNGWVDRNKLLAVRSRKPQITMIKKIGITEYPCPAGGCLLTYKEFASKIRDLFKHKKRITMKDILLLKIGRHFRFSKNKIIVGRNEQENKQLLNLKQKIDYLFEVTDYGSPITILQGPKTKEAMKIAVELTARYSDNKSSKIKLRYGRHLNELITVSSLSDGEIDKLRI